MFNLVKHCFIDLLEFFNMNDTNSNPVLKSILYIIAALAGAGLIIYGAFFYTKPSPENQKAQILPSNNSENQEQTYNEPILGNKNAPVTMIEYGSYLCGHCIDFSKNIFPLIYENYIKTGKVKFIYRSFPPYELSIALMCANEQNKFWEYHEKAIYSEISSIDDLKSFASAVGIEQESFNQCLDSQKYLSNAEKIITQGQELGVAGTPTFFINDEKIVGALPYEQFESAINSALNK